MININNNNYKKINNKSWKNISGNIVILGTIAKDKLDYLNKNKTNLTNKKE